MDYSKLSKVIDSTDSVQFENFKKAIKSTVEDYLAYPEYQLYWYLDKYDTDEKIQYPNPSSEEEFRNMWEDIKGKLNDGEFWIQLFDKNDGEEFLSQDSVFLLKEGSTLKVEGY